MEVSNDFFFFIRAEGPGSVPTTHLAAQEHLLHQRQSRGSIAIFWLLRELHTYGSPMNIQADAVGLCEHCTYIVHIKSKCKCKQNNHTHKIRISINKSLKNKITKGTEKVPDVDLWHQPK